MTQATACLLFWRMLLRAERTLLVNKSRLYYLRNYVPIKKEDKNMCLYPRLMKNKKYLPTKKNNYNPPIPKDERVKYVAVGCGQCIECRQQKAREWQFRLFNEIQNHKYKYFVTLTFSNESLIGISKKYRIQKLNEIATKAVRLMLERYRKKHKKTLKHWLITELGHTNTERIHLHGIIFSEEEITNEELSQIWSYGYTDTGKYCNEKTINYIIKYVTKIDNDHKDYTPKIMCSPGIGRSWTNNRIKERYRKEQIEYATLPNGTKINLPIYYRNKIYTEEEREQLWLKRLDENTMYIRGIELRNFYTKETQKQYHAILLDQQKINKQLGYQGETNYKLKDYFLDIKTLNNIKK